jgi:hypothetical protein
MARFIVVPSGAIGDLSVSQQMVEDLLSVSEVAADVIETLAATIKAESGFLGAKRLGKLVRQLLPDERQASATVTALEHVRPNGVEEVLSTIRQWRDADSRNAAKFPEEAMFALETKLPRLIQPYPALKRYRKARRLASIMGNAAEAVEVICDLRPVFDQDRDHVEGFVPLTTLKLVYEDQNDETRVLEVRLSEELLDALMTKGNMARQKLKVLRQMVGEWIPEGFVDAD